VKGFGVVLFVVLASAALAGCGSDNTTTFVLDSGTPTAAAAASATASPSASASAGASPASSSLPNTAATPIAGNLKIIIDTPDASTAISSPVQVSGAASVDKGTVVALVLDASGNELGRGTATASASKPDFGHYDVTVNFSGAVSGQKGQIKVFGVSPRDGTTPTYYYFVSIKFA
jgi:Immunoglobulin-like domain of bacterial spore germination